MSFNYDKLKGRIVEVYGTQYRFADAIGWSERTLCKKLKGEIAWKQTDICTAIKLLNLSADDIRAYFFTCKVQRVEQDKKHYIEN